VSFPPFNDRESGDLRQLSTLSRFLKGSSATLGVSKLKDSCEQMQECGSLLDEEATKGFVQNEALQKLRGLLSGAKEQYDEAAGWL
jgi:osomolarity two-component system phosphorelay intermediate protein YPD1